MSDILQRLLGYNPPDRTTDDQRQIAQDIKDAASTIASLREEVADLRAQNRDLRRDLDDWAISVFAQKNKALRARAEQAEAELAAERGKVEKQYELIDFYDAKVAAVMKWRESAYIPNDSDENELKRIMLGE